MIIGTGCSKIKLLEHEDHEDQYPILQSRAQTIKQIIRIGHMVLMLPPELDPKISGEKIRRINVGSFFIFLMEKKSFFPGKNLKQISAFSEIRDEILKR